MYMMEGQRDFYIYSKEIYIYKYTPKYMMKVLF